MAASVVAYVPCPVSSDAGRAFLQASEVKVPVGAARACVVQAGVVRVLTYMYSMLAYTRSKVYEW